MQTVVLVLIEVLIVIGLSRLVGLAFRWIKQPLVIGEIVAGVMLGPSLLGLLAPLFAATLFPPATIPFLNVLSQVGLIFFMFLIGLELDPKYLKGNLNVAILISNVSIIVPFSLAAILSLVLYPLVSECLIYSLRSIFGGSNVNYSLSRISPNYYRKQLTGHPFGDISTNLCGCG
jgi:Kef-type K+ transport system membrane component KefB